VQRIDLAAALRRNGTPRAQTALLTRGAIGTLPEDALEWSWPPYAPVETDQEPFDLTDWAPPSVVWHPQVRFGRWTVVYRRS